MSEWIDIMCAAERNPPLHQRRETIASILQRKLDQGFVVTEVKKRVFWHPKNPEPVGLFLRGSCWLTVVEIEESDVPGDAMKALIDVEYKQIDGPPENMGLDHYA